MLNLLAGADARTACATAHMAVGLEPADGAVEALPVVLISRSEPGGQVGELELLLIDLLTAADQLRGDRLTGPRHNSPDPSIHTRIVRTSVWSVNKIGLLISNKHQNKSRTAWGIPTNTGTLSASVLCPNSPFPVLFSNPLILRNDEGKDVRLDHCHHADGAGEDEAVADHPRKDLALRPHLVHPRRPDRKVLRADHLAHHAPRRVRARREDRAHMQLLGSLGLQRAEQRVRGRVTSG